LITSSNPWGLELGENAEKLNSTSFFRFNISNDKDI
jgi:hypothetical protein